MAQDTSWLDAMSTPVQNGKVLPDGTAVFNLPPNPADVAEEEREANKEARAEAEKTFRPVTEAERIERGLLPGGVYQINGLGEVKTITEPPKSEKNAVNKDASARNVARQLGELRTIFDRSFAGAGPVQSIFEFLPSDDRQKFQAIVRTMRADLKPLIRGPGEGTFTEGDQKLLDELLPDPDRFDAYNEQIFSEIENRVKGVLGEEYVAPAAAQPATRPAGEGEAFLTERDKELQDKLSQAYASGATLAELQALAQQYGQTIPIASQEELDAARAQGRGIVVTPTGREGGDAEYQSKVTAAADSFESRQGETGLAELAKQGVTLGLSDEAGGVGFALGQMLAGNFDVQDTYAFGRDVERELLRRARERTGGVGTAAELLGGGGAVRAVSAATTAGRAALEGAAGGSLGGFGYGEGTEGSLVGAGIGGATGGLISGGLQGLANRGAAQQARPRVIPDAADVIAAGEREGVDVMTSNVRPPRTWLGGWLRSTGEKLPIVGTAGTVAKQADQRAAMIERLADEYAQTPTSIDDVTADFIKTRGGEIAKYAQMKRDVFGQTAGAPPPVAQESIDALDMAIGRYGRQETFAGLTQKLQGWRNDLARAENINDIEAIRKSIGDTFGDQSMAASSAALKSIVDGPKGLYAALKNDMGGYIKDQAGQNAFRKWQVANGRLSDFAGDLEKTTLERVLKTGEATPEEARLLLFSNKPSDVRALFRNLSPQGKERARAVVVQKLIDDAGGGVAISELSPAKFRSSLEKSMERIGVAFPRQEADRFTGMLRLLQATQSAEKAAVITPTGQSTLPFLGAGAGAAAFSDLFTGGTIAAISMAAFRGYESKAMRNLLVALSKTKEGSKAEQNILGNIGRVLARTAPAAAAPTQATPEQQPTSTIEVR